jgi:hypothetical protein
MHPPSGGDCKAITMETVHAGVRFRVNRAQQRGCGNAAADQGFQLALSPAADMPLFGSATIPLPCLGPASSRRSSMSSFQLQKRH